MMQAAEDRQRVDVSESHGASTKWGVMAERKVSTRRIVIVGIRGQHAAEMRLTENHNVVEARTPDGTD